MEDAIDKHKQEITDLRAKLNTMRDEQMLILRYFDLIIVDSSDDLRIIDVLGPVEEMFPEAKNFFDKGSNLVKAIYKITQNTRIREEEVHDAVREEEFQLDLEELVNRFITGNREEKKYEVLGETDTGEVFLLIWQIKRLEKTFRSYLKIIPSNSIVKSLQTRQEEELLKYKIEARLIYSQIQDGITILGLDNRISFMNDVAKSLFFSYKAGVTQKANFEGRYFHELFINESSDLLKHIIDYNKVIVENRKAINFSAKFGDQTISVHLRPLMNERHFITGIVIICRKVVQEMNFDVNQLLVTLKNLSLENKKLFARTREFEANQRVLNANIQSLHNTVHNVYRFLEKMPFAVSIIKLPSVSYEFVNERFEKLTQLKREQLRGKNDAQIFPLMVSNALLDFINQTIEDPNENFFKYDVYTIRQAAIFNETNEPTYLIRLIEF